MTAYDPKIMEMAEKEAESNLQTKEGGPFGSVIVDKEGKVVATGHNQVLHNNDPSAHGEIVTMRKACQKLGTYDLSGCTLYTNAYPCPMCLAAIIWANIKTVYYGNTAKDAADIGFRDDFIYKFINGGASDASVLHLAQHDRDKTMKSFHAFKADSAATIY